MKVGIVNDMEMSREVLSRIVATDPECEVIWTAASGAEAIRNCAAMLPDLLIMDIFMPGMDGAEASRRIMAATPCPILVVTASIDTRSSKVFETLGAGAMDAIKTPCVGPDGKLDGVKELQRKLGQFKQLTHQSQSVKKRHESPERLDLADGASPVFVAIGASTGGPNALADLLSPIPASANAAFVVIQHVDKQFAQGLATWLDSLCHLDVRIAKAGDKPRRGVVLIAATNDHMILGCDGSLQYSVEPEDNPFRPSADVFFTSLACKCREKGVAVLLTGIGRDGAAGLLALKNAGWRTFAQSKDSCVVYGMPKAAAELGAAEEILSPKDIGLRIASLSTSFQKGA